VDALFWLWNIEFISNPIIVSDARLESLSNFVFLLFVSFEVLTSYSVSVNSGVANGSGNRVAAIDFPSQKRQLRATSIHRLVRHAFHSASYNAGGLRLASSLARKDAKSTKEIVVQNGARRESRFGIRSRVERLCLGQAGELKLEANLVTAKILCQTLFLGRLEQARTQVVEFHLRALRVLRGHNVLPSYFK